MSTRRLRAVKPGAARHPYEQPQEEFHVWC
jgi:hypothetical protein